MKIEVNITELDALAGRLTGIDTDGIGATVMRVVNNVIDDVYDMSRKHMNADINLKDEYLRERMTVAHATDPGNTQATITVGGKPGQLTRLARYDPIQIRENGKRAGVSVEVTRGGRKDFQWGFFKTLKNGNGQGVFTRNRDGEVKHRYGPSVYQLFNHYLMANQGEIRTTLETQLVDAINLQITKALK